MHRPHVRLPALLLSFTAFNAFATVFYVDLNSGSPTAPFTNWSTAATNIQDAVDAAAPGDTVLVTNGVYNTGGRVVAGLMTNRVVVDKAITVQSVLGAAFTAIHGHQVPGATNGNEAIRGVYLAHGASLSGFTIANGATRTAGTWDDEQSGGGLWCQSTNVTVSDCVLDKNVAWDSGGAAYYGTFRNCTFTRNTAYNLGGAAYASVLEHCTLTGNFCEWGGGAAAGWSDQAILDHCTLTDNTSGYQGGAAAYATLTYCTLSNNVVTDLYSTGEAYGGGISEASAYNCLLVGNSAFWGGGADSSSIYNCVIVSNYAAFDGGGAGYCDGNNCTIIGNSAGQTAGGLDASELKNSIIYYNSAPIGPNYHGSGCSSCYAMEYCCTTPLPSPPDGGAGNIDSDPQLADSSHLSAISPCRSAGNPAYLGGVDIDGEPWANPPSIGCDQFYGGAITGPLSVAIAADSTNTTPMIPIAFTSVISGHATSNWWDFGDGSTVANQPFASHDWTAPGDYLVRFAAYNDSHPGGVSATQVIQVALATVLYVDAGGKNPLAPFASWDTAATNIQDAINAAPPGALVVVTNGIYNRGGTVMQGAVTNRIAIRKPLVVQSVNGPLATVIEGAAGIRCAYLVSGAVLNGFTLRNGVSLQSGDPVLDLNGGGAWCESSSSSIFNCVFSGNSAAASGGAVSGGTLYHCSIFGNSAAGEGGGVHSGVLNNCTLTGNSAPTGGGAHSSTLRNCIAWYNLCPNSLLAGSNFYQCTLMSSCTAPLPASGTGNFSSEPLLADFSHISLASPCHGTGSSAFTRANDIDGDPWTNPPDIGCDQYNANSITGALSVAIQVQHATVPKDYPVELAAVIGGHASSHRWSFGDGTYATNRLHASHLYAGLGDFSVVLTAYNGSNPDGVSAIAVIHVIEAKYYVSVNSTNPSSPFISWDTAATNIQDALDVAAIGGTVIVSNGVYNSGGRIAFGSVFNRVAVTKPVTLRSLNGPAVTFIDGNPVVGDSAIRGVWLTNGASFSGFSIRKGGTRNAGDIQGEQCGAGLWAQSTLVTISNCVFSSNVAHWFGGGAHGGTFNNCQFVGNTVVYNNGGGASTATLNNCLLRGNLATGTYASGAGAFRCTLNKCFVVGNRGLGSVSGGGGADQCTLNNCLVISNSAPYVGGVQICTANNCTIVGNSAAGAAQSWGGGAGNSTLNNCIVYYNYSPSLPDCGYNTSASHCCVPTLQEGPRNFTHPPGFVDLAAGDFRLQSTSSCINSGLNASAPAGTDYGGNTRIIGNAVDVGAYEFQSPTSVLSYAWLQQYGLPTDGSADFVDSDADRMNNWQEWRANTDPTSALSALRMLSVSNAPPNVAVTWQSVSHVTYYLDRSTNIGAGGSFATVRTSILSQGLITTCPDTNPPANAPVFYRVGVQ